MATTENNLKIEKQEMIKQFMIDCSEDIKIVFIKYLKAW